MRACLSEVETVAYQPDQKSYRVRMKLANIDGARPLYVMLGPGQGLRTVGPDVEGGSLARQPHGESARVVKLTNSYAFETIFEPNVRDWTELIPGYIHIRFETNSLVSERSDPDDDIVDRTDRYYVYLKPHGADDDAIRKRMKSSGDPPVYLPMPPH